MGEGEGKKLWDIHKEISYAKGPRETIPAALSIYSPRRGLLGLTVLLGAGGVLPDHRGIRGATDDDGAARLGTAG